MTTILYGIPNCDTVKKARKWLEANGVEYEFANFKKTPPTEAKIVTWLNAVGAEKLVNKRGTTWQKLSEAEQQLPPEALLTTHSSIIKRPVLEHNGAVYVAFSDATYADIFAA